MRKDTKVTADVEEPVEVDDLEAPDADEVDLEDLAEAELLEDDDEDLGDVALVDELDDDIEVVDPTDIVVVVVEVYGRRSSKKGCESCVERRVRG